MTSSSRLHSAVLRAFVDAAEDDEPLTEAETDAIEEAEADVQRGDTVSWEVYRAGRAQAS